MKHAAIWITAALICIGLSVVWSGEPSETDAAQASALDLQDAIHTARVAHNQPKEPK